MEMTATIFLTLLSLLFVSLVHSSNVTEKTTASPSTTVKSSHGGQIPLIFHHRGSSQKRHRRQYQSEKAPPYEIRFLPYPAPPPLRQVRDSINEYSGTSSNNNNVNKNEYSGTSNNNNNNNANKNEYSGTSNNNNNSNKNEYSNTDGSNNKNEYSGAGNNNSNKNDYSGNSINTEVPSTTASTSTTSEAPLTYPAPTLITTSPSTLGTSAYGRVTPSPRKTNHFSAYMQPPNGLPRESGHENSPANTNYFYPPRMPLPLSNCFFNPTGYACCNAQLNDLMVETYSELEAKPNFHVCNINAIASMLQSKAEKRFNVSFETVAGFEDFAQKVHFNGDLICKIELGSKYMLAYATAGHKNGTGANGANGSTYNKYSGEPLKRQKRQVVYGPENELPPNHITKQHSMWI